MHVFRWVKNIAGCRPINNTQCLLKFTAKSSSRHDVAAIIYRKLTHIAHGLRCRLGNDPFHFRGGFNYLSAISLDDNPHDLVERSKRFFAKRI
jgi:hypothetical protein